MPVDLEARPCLADMRARPGRKLTAGGGVALNGGGNFLEAEAEHVVQQEGRPLERREAFERQHQRQGDVVDLVFRDLAPAPQAFAGTAYYMIWLVPKNGSPQAVGIITRDYYRQLNRNQLLNQGLSAMVASLDDPYSHYFPPSQYDSFQQETNPQVAGIGVEVAVQPVGP